MLRQSRRLALALMVLALVLAAVVFIAVPGTASSNNDAAGVALSRVSVRGIAQSLPVEDPWSKQLIAAGFTDVRQIASASGTDFYRLTKEGRKSCYGVGSAGAASPIGFIGCSQSFPSPENPIMDLSIVGAEKGSDAYPHLIFVQGIAADGVATIELRNASNAAVARAPVRQNVYVLKEAPRAAIRVVAVDSSGREVG